MRIVHILLAYIYINNYVDTYIYIYVYIYICIYIYMNIYIYMYEYIYIRIYIYICIYLYIYINMSVCVCRHSLSLSLYIYIYVHIIIYIYYTDLHMPLGWNHYMIGVFFKPVWSRMSLTDTANLHAVAVQEAMCIAYLSTLVPWRFWGNRSSNQPSISWNNSDSFNMFQRL